mmetsp:Transcript_9688/g.28776  ORF Transcript_9688/g.28776 Transcript_9688/m.28776 type:complete len:230 (-) Transcript_9688:18-707(-)
MTAAGAPASHPAPPVAVAKYEPALRHAARVAVFAPSSPTSPWLFAAAPPSDVPSDTSRIICAVRRMVGKDPSSAMAHWPSANKKSPPNKRMKPAPCCFGMPLWSFPAVNRSACASPKRLKRVRPLISGRYLRRASPASTVTVTSKAGNSSRVSDASFSIRRKARGAVRPFARSSFRDLMSSQRTDHGSAGSNATASAPPKSRRRKPLIATVAAASTASPFGHVDAAGGG